MSREPSVVIPCGLAASGFASRSVSAGVVLHLVDQTLRRDERVLQRALALGDAACALLLRRDLLLEQRDLFEDGFVVLGDVVEERVDLLRVVALENLGRELLLPDVVRSDTHRRLAISS